MFLRFVLLMAVNFLRVGLRFLTPSDDDLRIFEKAQGLARKSAFTKISLSKKEIGEIVRDTFLLSFKVLVRRPLKLISPQKLGNPKDPKIITPPGGRILAIADFFCSPKTMELTVKSTIADWHEEYFAALSQGRVWKARFVSMRYYCRFVKIFGLKKLAGVFKAFSKAG